MKILLAGHKGQLGSRLFTLFTADDVLGIDLPDHDITDRDAMIALAREFRPDLVVNAAAMTNVDGCARDPALAYRVNGMGTQNLALAAADVDADMLQISTNEVFDGTASQPYAEWHATHPINPYGLSKLAGEWYAQHLLTRFYIVRTAWLYAAGGRNFPHRIIQLADERGALRVVTDEVSNPTYVNDLASALVALIASRAYGVYHLVNEGVASRYDFAKEILRLSGREYIPVHPISSAEFDRASTPPSYAPLANYAAAGLGICLRPWQVALADFLDTTGYKK